MVYKRNMMDTTESLQRTINARVSGTSKQHSDNGKLFTMGVRNYVKDIQFKIAEKKNTDPHKTRKLESKEQSIITHVFLHS